MQLSHRKNDTAHLYFEIDTSALPSSSLVKGVPARSVGAFFLAIGSTIHQVATLVELESGGLWFDYGQSHQDLIYVNKDRETLAEACSRWRDVWADRRGLDEFVNWLHLVDPFEKQQSEAGTTTLWENEYAEFVGPF